MVSRAEEGISRSLRKILAALPNSANIPDSETFRQSVLSGLEWWLPGIIGEIHPEVSGMILDGIYAPVARKTGHGEAEIIGQCIFLDDQTLTPIYMHLQIADSTDEVTWLLCKLGEKLEGKPVENGKNGMVRLSYTSLNSALRRIDRLDGNPDKIDWVYKVTFGERRP